MEFLKQELLLAGLEDILHQATVVDVGAVEADTKKLLDLDGRPGAEGFGNLPGALAPIAGGDGRQGESERHEVEGQCQRSPPSALQPHGPGRKPTSGTNPGF